MKTFLLAVGSLSLASTPFMAPTAAQAQSLPNASASEEIETFCKPTTEAGGFASVGECAKFIRTDGLRFCEFLKDIDVYPLILVTETGEQEVANQGQCNSFFRQD
jgi:hypothetical protein